jgi:hypothetical protein
VRIGSALASPKIKRSEPWDRKTAFSGGAAIIVGLAPWWDLETEIRGIHTSDSDQMYSGHRSHKVIDCTFDGQGDVPGTNKEWFAERCTFKQGLEIDKLLELVQFNNCHLPGGVIIQSTSVDRIVFDGCDGDIIAGTAKLTEVRNCSFGEFTVGPLLYGASEAVVIENSRINSFDWNKTFYTFPTILATLNLVERMGFSNGTLSLPLTKGPISWAVPGAKGFVSDFAGRFDNMGMPFTILDVRTDGTNTLVDTTLTTKPVGNSTHSTVTISIAGPGVITWATHGLTAGTPIALITTGALPTGLIERACYFVLAAGLTTNTFEVSTSAGGTPVTTSGSQSGVHTAISNSLIYLQHPCPRITIKNCVGAPSLSDMGQGPSEVPIFSYARRFITQDGAGTSGAGAANIPQPYVWGNLVSLTVKVLKAYSGATNPFSLLITAKAFDGSLVESDLSLSIDLRTTGKRVITPTAATGSVGADSIASFANWISGKVTCVFNGDAVADATQPQFAVEIITDQGITAYRSVQYTDQSAGGFPEIMLADTNWGLCFDQWIGD